MVTTFSARLLSLANRCNPIVGGDKKRKSDAVSNFTNSTTADQQTAAQPSTTTKKNNIKMQGGNHINSYYYASLYTHPSNDATPSGNKRRRQKEELQYTAATIQSALEDAGRPPMSMERREHALSLLGSGTGSGTSVDMTSATVMTSSEFDEMENNNDTTALKTEADPQPQGQGCEEEEAQAETSTATQDVSTDIIGRSRNRSAAASSTSNGYGDVSSMYMLGSLVQSTRQYYNYACDYDTTTVSTPIISNLPTKKKARYTYTAPCTSTNHSASEKNDSMNTACDINENESIQMAMNMRACAQYNTLTTNDEKQSEDTNSEGLSSWTPTSSCERLELGLADMNDKKNIDNDNRSDGQSSNSSETTCSSSSEEEDSISSSEEEHEHSDLLTTKDGNGFDDGLIIYGRNVTLLDNGAFSIVG